MWIRDNDGRTITNVNDRERRLWVLNDQGLYRWWKSSRKSMGQFIRENRTELTEVISRALNAEPRRP